jgi:hypothetical protein
MTKEVQNKRELLHTLFIWGTLLIMGWLCFVNTAVEMVNWDVRTRSGEMHNRGAEYARIYYSQGSGFKKYYGALKSAWHGRKGEKK